MHFSILQFTGRKKKTKSGGSSTDSISARDMELILEKLKSQTTRNSTAANYHTIWKGFNKFILQLDSKPKTWEQRLCLYGTFLVESGIQSSTLRSYFSAIKKTLTLDGYKFNEDLVLLSSISKACRIINDRVQPRQPIKLRMLELLLFELERIFNTQYYLEIVYKTMLIIGFYGLLRIGEVAYSQHCIKAAHISMGVNKNKILIILYSSKTHGAESSPQKIKIIQANGKQRQFFCPFKLMSKFIKIRGTYKTEQEPLFIYRDKMPVMPATVNAVLKKAIKRCGMVPASFSFHSLRTGRTSQLIQLGYTIEAVKRLGRWKSNAVYRYIKQ